jgi:hypothetical protein
MFDKIIRYTVTYVAITSVLFIKVRRKKKKDKTDEEEEYKNSLLCRFVLDGIGNKVGESVAVDEDILIVKKGKRYLGVPLKHVEEEGKTLLVRGLVDNFNAEMMGEKWRQDNFKEIKLDKD